MEESKEFYAFISYKREDEKWAKWLQDKLEHYKFPTNLNGRADLPKNIRPTFRDVTDLKPGLLAEEINNALVNSQWLIIVCSPRSAKSPWVCKEAQTFIDLGRSDHIIPFVIEGNPFSDDTASECYPEALLNLTGSQELLAANINEMGRDAAVIKVVARMFGLRFDTLWQRHEKEKRRRRNWIITAAASFVFAILGVSGYILLLNRQLEIEKSEAIAARNTAEKERNRAEDEKIRANKEKNRAELAEDSIRRQIGIIKQINNNLARSNTKVRKNLSLYISNKAFGFYEYDSYLARKLAVAALTQETSYFSEIYVPEAEKLLRLSNKSNNAIVYPPQHKSFYYADISSDNSTIIAIPMWKQYAYLIDRNSGKIIESFFDFPEKIRNATFNNKGDIISFSMANGKILIYKKTPKGWFLSESLYGHNNDINDIAFSSDDKYMVSASTDKTMRVWESEPSGWVCIDTLYGHSQLINHVDFSNNGYNIVSSSCDSTIRIWRKKTNKWTCTDTLIGHSDWVYSASFGKNTSRIISAAKDGTVRLWGIRKQNWVCTDTIYVKGVRSVNFSPKSDNCFVTSSMNNQVFIWQKIWKEWHQTDTLNGGYLCANWSKDGKYIISTNTNLFINEVKIYDYPNFPNINIKKAVFSNDGKSALVIKDKKNQIEVLNVIDNKWHITEHINSPTTFVAYHGKDIVTVSSDTIIFLWKYLEKLEWDITGQYHHNSPIVTITSSDKNRQLVIGDKNNTIYLLKTDKKICAIDSLYFDKDFFGKITKIIWNDTQNKVYVGCMKFIAIFNITEGKFTLPTFIMSHNGNIADFAISHNGKTIAIDESLNDYIVIYKNTDNSLLWEKYDSILTHPSLIRTNLTFSYDDQYLGLSEGLGKKHICFWNLKDKQCVDIIHGVILSPMGSSTNGIYFLYKPLGGKAIYYYRFSSLRNLINETRERFKDNPLTPEERRQYYLLE